MRKSQLPVLPILFCRRLGNAQRQLLLIIFFVKCGLKETVRKLRKRLVRVLIEVWQLEFLEPLELSASVEIASTTGGQVER